MRTYYIAFNTKLGSSWIVTNTLLDLDDAKDLVTWIEEKEKTIDSPIVPVFWKELK